MKPLLVAVAFCAALSLPALAEDWTSLLSPRMREEMKPMLSSHWSPKREVELTAAERRDLGRVSPRVEEQAHRFLRQEKSLLPLEPAAPNVENKGVESR